jgi:integrase
MSNSTTRTTPGKPPKPYPEFPLFPHATRRWAKKIRGKLHYFGPWRDPDAALQKYLDQKDDLHAGRTPRVQGDGLTVRDLLNRFLTSKQRMVDSGEMANRSFLDYHRTAELIKAEFGLTRLIDDLAADDFEAFRSTLTKGRGPVTVANEIRRTRTIFKYAYDMALIDRPVRHGPAFKKPSKGVMRKDRNAKPKRMFESGQIKSMIEAAPPGLRAMIFLGINAGLSNSDVGKITRSTLDLKAGWLDYPRPKTGIARRAPLWPKTVSAIKEAITSRPTAKDEADDELVFLTRCGRPWARDHFDNPVSNEVAKLLKDLELHRPGLNFLALRHTFETIAGDSRDQVAVDYVMGHARDDMASRYREHIEDARLLAVTDHVHKWLFGRKPRRPSKPK